jgi:hypothetical protein
MIFIVASGVLFTNGLRGNRLRGNLSIGLYDAGEKSITGNTIISGESVNTFSMSAAAADAIGSSLRVRHTDMSNPLIASSDSQYHMLTFHFPPNCKGTPISEESITESPARSVRIISTSRPGYFFATDAKPLIWSSDKKRSAICDSSFSRKSLSCSTFNSAIADASDATLARRLASIALRLASSVDLLRTAISFPEILIVRDVASISTNSPKTKMVPAQNIHRLRQCSSLGRFQLSTMYSTATDATTKISDARSIEFQKSNDDQEEDIHHRIDRIVNYMNGASRRLAGCAIALFVLLILRIKRFLRR